MIYTDPTGMSVSGVKDSTGEITWTYNEDNNSTYTLTDHEGNLISELDLNDWDNLELLQAFIKDAGNNGYNREGISNIFWSDLSNVPEAAAMLSGGSFALVFASPYIAAEASLIASGGAGTWATASGGAYATSMTAAGEASALGIGLLEQTSKTGLFLTNAYLANKPAIDRVVSQFLGVGGPALTKTELLSNILGRELRRQIGKH